MNRQEFKMTTTHKIWAIIWRFAVYSIFAAFIFGLVFSIFPKMSGAVMLAIIIVFAGIVIAVILHKVLVAFRRSIIVDGQKVTVMVGDKVSAEYPFAQYAFSSSIYNRYYYGIKISTRSLVFYDVNTGDKVGDLTCNFLNKNDFNTMMTLLDNYSLRYDNAAVAGVSQPVASVVSNETVAAEPVVQKQNISTSYRLRVENVKIDAKKIILLSCIVSLGLMFLFSLLFLEDLLDGARITSSTIEAIVLYIVLAVGAGVLLAVVSFATRGGRISRAKMTTPETISVSNTAITFGGHTYLPENIESIVAMPASYNTQRNADAIMRPLTIKTKDGKSATYTLGTAKDPKRPERAIFTADEYGDLLYNLRQVFIDRPGVFSHQLESYNY